MKYEISQFEIDSYSDVLSLWERCDGIGLSDADSRESIQAYFERNPAMSFIAKSDRIVIGAVLAGHDGRRGYIHHLAVHPNHRYQGIARHLVENCMSALTNAGIQKCHVFIFNDNTNGIKFWKSIGWGYRSDIGVISKIIEPKFTPDRG